MKKIALLIGFAVASFATVSDASAQAAMLGPKITYEVDYVDYGEVEFGGNGERSWKFKNTGKEPLIITNAKGSCGCTVPTYPKEAIMPGQTKEITIKPKR
jgi:hypothetical protein